MLNETHQLSFGCSGLAGLYQPVSNRDVEEVLNAAWDSGIRYFDTAPHYGNGASEQRLGQFLRDKTGWTLSTKVGRVLRPDGSGFANLFAGGGAACGVSGTGDSGYLSGNGLLAAVTLGWAAGQASL